MVVDQRLNGAFHHIALAIGEKTSEINRIVLSDRAARQSLAAR